MVHKCNAMMNFILIINTITDNIPATTAASPFRNELNLICEWKRRLKQVAVMFSTVPHQQLCVRFINSLIALCIVNINLTANKHKKFRFFFIYTKNCNAFDETNREFKRMSLPS